MKKFKLTILGIGALALMLGLNIRHAVNNYGIMDGKLHTEILAQSNSSGGGSGSSSSTIYDRTTGPCSITIAGQGIPVVIGGITFTIPAGGTLKVTFENLAVNCKRGGNSMCSPVNCDDFLSGGSSGSGSGSN